MRESTGKNFAVAAIVAVACSLLVSLTAVGLRGRRDSNRDIERMRHVLSVAGLDEQALDRVEARVVDLDAGTYVAEESYDPSAFTALAPDSDIAGIERRERFVRVYLVRDLGRIAQIVLPVRGEGWSMLHGYLALDRDLVTIRGLTFYRHEETAGMGAEVDNPRWKQQWRGKRLYDADGKVRIRLVKQPSAAEAAFEVDAITGATMTTDGVTNLVRFWFGDLGFRRFLDTLKEKGVDHG